MDLEGVTIRPVHLADIASWDTNDDWLAGIAALLQEWGDEFTGEPAVGMWVLWHRELIVGCVGIRRRRLNGRLELSRLHVQPEYRGRGLSKLLIRHALGHAHAHSNEAVTSQVRLGNAPATAALAAFGFRELSRNVRHTDGATILLLEET